MVLTSLVTGATSLVIVATSLAMVVTSLVFLYNFIRITVVLVTVVAASLEHVILYQIIDRFMAELGRAGGA